MCSVKFIGKFLIFPLNLPDLVTSDSLVMVRSDKSPVTQKHIFVLIRSLHGFDGFFELKG